jgi:hypothetical protein
MKRQGIRWAAALLALWAGGAGATDIVNTEPGVALSDRQVSIGRRAMTLPEGKWTYIARSEGAVRHGGIDRKGVHYTAYAMDTDGTRMVAGVTLRLMVNSFPLLKGWEDEPCKVKGHIYRDDFDSGYDRPRCLVVYKRRTHLAQSHEGLYGQAAEWMRAQGIQQPGPTYEIVYTNLAANELGVVHVFLPARSVDGDGAAVAWAKQLPAQFESFFANTQAFAALPPLPVRAKP